MMQEDNEDFKIFVVKSVTSHISSLYYLDISDYGEDIVINEVFIFNKWLTYVEPSIVPQYSALYQLRDYILNNQDIKLFKPDISKSKKRKRFIKSLSFFC